MLRKEKNFENFLNDKIVNLVDSSKESIIYSNRIFGEFCEKTHGKTMDEVITEDRKDEFPDEVILEVLWDWL